MRRLCWFSCGCPSAVAARLSLAEHPGTCEVLYCDTGGEHTDNQRFLHDCERWLGTPIKILRNDKFVDHVDVARYHRYINGPTGAKCTRELKIKLRLNYQRPGDIHVFGLAADELPRIERMTDSFPDLDLEFPLLDAGLTREDCLALIQRVPIELPIMYKMGYKNNNCIGCWKGGKGYWNKVRRDFPEAFARAAALGDELQFSPFSDVLLSQLDPDAGRYQAEDDPQCGLTCYAAEQRLRLL